MNIFKQIWKSRMELIWIILCSLIPFLWFNGGEVILGHDAGFRLNFIEHLKNLTYAWNPYTNFGIDWSLYFGFIPIQLPETVFSFITGSLSLGQRMTFSLYFAGTGLSMYIFTRYFFPDTKYLPLRIIAPFFYTVNYYLIDAWAIAERAKFSLYIALPLFIVLFHKAIHNKLSILRAAIYTAFLFTILNGGGSPPLYGSVIVAGCIYFLYMIVYPNEISRFRILKFAFVAGLLTICLNAYWIIPQFKLASSSYGNALQDRGGIEGLIAWEGEVSKHASFLNLMRLQGFPDWYGNTDHPYANVVLSNPLLIVLSWLPLATIVSGLLLLRFQNTAKREKKIITYLVIVAVVGLFFAMGSHKPTGILYVYLMRYVPGFAMFRSSFFKFAPLIYFPMIIFFSFYVSQFTKKKQFTVTICVLILLSIYHFPAFTGNIFGLKWGFSTKVTVPEYVNGMGHTIRALTKPDDRILVLPPLDTGFINSPIDTYTWGFYSLDILPRILVNRPFLANDSNDNGLTRLLYTKLSQGDESSFLRLSETLGVRHILWRGDVRLTALTSEQFPLSHWESRIASLSSVKKIAQESKWSLYRIGEIKQSEDISVSGIVDIVRTDTVNTGHLIAGREPEKLTPIISSDTVSDISVAVPVASVTVQADCFFCKDHEFEKLVESVRLPVYKRNRFNFLRDRQIAKENRAVKESLNTPAEIDAQLSIASNRLSSYITTKNGSDLSEITAHIDRVMSILNGMKNDRLKDMYTNRVTGYLTAFVRDSTETPVATYLSSMIEEVNAMTWKAEGVQYRFGVFVDQDDTYALHTTDLHTYAPLGYIDGTSFRLSEPVTLTRGYHRLELTVKEAQETSDSIKSPVFLVRKIAHSPIAIPSISVRKIDPASYGVSIRNAEGAFVLTMNQRFSQGWGIEIDNEIQPYSHLEANGYANAWIIPKTGSYDLSIQYMPQSQARSGRMISLFTLVASMIILIFFRRKI